MLSLKEKIKQKAFELGFCLCGMTSPHQVQYSSFLQKWLKKNYHGKMQWLESKNRELLNPALFFPEIKSIISVADTYYFGSHELTPVLARYALGYDYHIIMKKRLYLLLDYIRSQSKHAAGIVTCDNSPVLEKYWAREAGLGWIGKNTLLINNRYGSYLTLGEILLNIPLPPDQPVRDKCNNCSQCIQACPSHALKKPYLLDTNQCISYLTVEYRHHYNRQQQQISSGHFFGCDICQEACPYNQDLKPGRPDLYDFPEFIKSLQNFFKNPNPEAGIKKKQTALHRLNRLMLRRNKKNVTG